jgi:hypothetical protein
MKLSEDLETKMLAYLDGSLSQREKQDFEAMMAGNPDLKTRLKLLKRTETLWREYRIETPSRNFTEKVMANLHGGTVPGNGSVLNSLLLLAGIVALVSLCALLLSAGLFDSSTASIDFNKIGLLEKYFHVSIPSIGLNGKLIINIILFLNVLIALIVLDRSVLKPFFQRRLRTGV